MITKKLKFYLRCAFKTKLDSKTQAIKKHFQRIQIHAQ